jgi:hypothetical protein
LTLRFRFAILYVVILFLVETFLQILFYTISIKYFDKYSHDEKMGKIFTDSCYAVGTVKMVFFLPVYLIFYLVFNRPESKSFSLQRDGYHAILFLAVYLFVSIILPGDVAFRIVDTIFLTVIAFVCSVVLRRNIKTNE